MTLVDGAGNVTAPARTNTVTVEGVRVSFTGVPAAGDAYAWTPGTFDLFALYDDLISVAQAPPGRRRSSGHLPESVASHSREGSLLRKRESPAPVSAVLEARSA